MKRKKKTFGFIINNIDFPVDVKETTEKKATIKFIDKYWKRIKDVDEKQAVKIEILGKQIKKTEERPVEIRERKSTGLTKIF